jgi:catechol 2,3-dioxygenase-like lactoylglutathione lyase family enzyme
MSFLVAGAWVWLAAAVAPAPVRHPPLVEGVDAIAITVSDMERAVDFYSRVLAFEKVSDVEVTGERYEHLEGVFGLRMRVVRMKLGDESIELVEYLTPRGRLAPTDSRSNDLWFQHIAIIVSDMDTAYLWLHQHNVEHVSSAPQLLPTWNTSAGGISAFYFKDPDRHPIEVLHFPKGKGAEKWHRPTNKLFLGIDHTAIVVANTDASLRFYQALLGLRVTGRSENYGTEQEHLSSVFGAHVRITSLRGTIGPGIELLEYLTPRDGRIFPTDEHANDLVHCQTTLVSSDARRVARELEDRKVPFVSSGVIVDRDSRLGFEKAVGVRDPDGHAVEIGQK